jgi:hypothetical protein
MNIDNLVTMANQIGTFFESYPTARRLPTSSPTT